jgi:deoxyribodipyrimidine photolyase-like uncharacterized protein
MYCKCSFQCFSSPIISKPSGITKKPCGLSGDGLFWRFMHVHRGFFLKNPRLGMLVNTYDKMAAEKQQLHLANAEQFLQHSDTHK